MCVTRKQDGSRTEAAEMRFLRAVKGCLCLDRYGMKISEINNYRNP
jgi:hypothetical protein